jgi:putative addiction module component (TIGR02574 family)
MTKISIDEIMNLTISERLELVELIWDSLGAEPEEPLSDEARAELDRRLALVEATPGVEPSWAEEVARLGVFE